MNRILSPRPLWISPSRSSASSPRSRASPPSASTKPRPPSPPTPDVQMRLTSLLDLAGDVAKKSHRLSFTLRPTMLDDLGLVGALRNYAEEWSQWSDLLVAMEVVGIAGADDTDKATTTVRVERLPREIETTIYRVAQEALTNVLRYASGHDGRKAATHVVIALQHQRTEDSNEVRAVIEDDGPGFDVEAVLSQPPGKRRLGIFGMQERARLVGGTLDIESAIGEGTSVFLSIPL